MDFKLSRVSVFFKITGRDLVHFSINLLYLSRLHISDFALVTLTDVFQRNRYIVILLYYFFIFSRTLYIYVCIYVHMYVYIYVSILEFCKNAVDDKRLF